MKFQKQIKRVFPLIGLLLTLLTLSVVTMPVYAAPGPNELTNPGCETGFNPPTGWSIVSGGLYCQTGGGIFPPANEGTHIFGDGEAATGVLEQTYDFGGDLANHNFWYSFAYYDNNVADTGTVTYQFLDASSTVVGTLYDSGAGGLNDNAASWTTISGGPITAPATTQQIKVTMTCNNSASWCDVYFDSFSLTREAPAPVDPEPDNHPAAFTATADSTSQITTSWTDSIGTNLPAGYLVMCSTTDSFTNPTDGTAQSDDSDCSDGTGVMNVAHGTGGSYAWTGLSSSIQYYYTIFPYSNSGAIIDYKTDATPGTANATTLKAEPTNHPTGFNAAADSSSQISTSWTDSTGGTIPDGYLVLCNLTGTFNVPVDGAAQSDDSDCSDGTGVMNVAHGAGSSYAWTGLNSGTQYFYEIFPYSNSGAIIDYKTDGTPGTANATTTAAGCTIYSSTDVPQIISDIGTPTVLSVINVPDSGIINDINVLNLAGTHTWVGDLDFQLESPTATIVQLRDQGCGDEDDFNINYDDAGNSPPSPCPLTGGLTYQPDGPGTLADVNGENSSGTWTLTINDNANQDGGELTSWSLEICSTPLTLIQLDLSDNHTDPVGNWHTIADTDRNNPVSGLIDFNTGVPTAVSYTGSGWDGGYGQEDYWIVGDKGWVTDDAADDLFYRAGSATSTITFGGLTGSHYIIELVTTASTEDIGDYTIGGSFANRTYNCTFGVNGDNFNTLVDGRDPGNWLIWDNVEPSGGEIVMTFVAGAGEYVVANAIRLQEVFPNTPVTTEASKATQCSGGLVIADSGFLQDAGDQIDFFHNGSANDNVPDDLGSSGVVQRWSRVWDCTVTDIGSNNGTVDVTFDFVLGGMSNSLPPAGAASNYKLLHRPGPTGDFSVIATSDPVVDTAGWTVTFENVTVDPTGSLCSEITLGTTDANGSPTAVSLQSITVTNNSAMIPILIAIFMLLFMGGFVVLRRRA